MLIIHFAGISTLFIGPLTTWWFAMAIWLKKEIIFMNVDELLRLKRKWQSVSV